MADQRQYSTLEWYEYRNYTMINTSDKQLTIDEFFDQQKALGVKPDYSAEERIERVLSVKDFATAKIPVPKDQASGKNGVINQLRVAGLFVSTLQTEKVEGGEDRTFIYVTRKQEEADDLIKNKKISFGSKYPGKA